MEYMWKLLQIILEAALLFLCCGKTFREKGYARFRDIVLLPLFILFCAVARLEFVYDRDWADIRLMSQGFELAPADNLYFLLFLILAVLLVNSLYFSPRDNSYAFCGTAMAFSIEMVSKIISTAVLFRCGVSGNFLTSGSLLLSLFLAALFLYSPVFDRLRRLLGEGGFVVRLVCVNFMVVLITILSMSSFELTRLMEKWTSVTMLFLMLLLLDFGLLFWEQRRIQERRRIQMIEQYVPIVEELISQVRARQHEFSNRLLAIEAAVESAETLEEAKKSVALLSEGTAVDAADRQLLACDSKIIAGMLYGKMKQADFSHRKVIVEFQTSFKDSSLPETAWIEILGILLDNAIEASGEGDRIYVRSCRQEEYTELTVANPFRALSNAEFMQLFRRGLTTKKREREAHGYGLFRVLAITEHYRGKIITRNERKDERNYVVFGVRVR